MSEKTIKIKYNGDWNTIPGPSGDLNVEGESIEDTILGQSWSSNWVGLLNWNVTSTAYWKGTAGYEAKVIKDGDEMSASSFTLTQSADTVSASTLPAVQSNGGYVVQKPGLRTVNLSVSGFYDGIGLIDQLTNRSLVTIKIQPAGGTGFLTEAEGDFIHLSEGLSGEVGGNEDDELSFGLHVAVDDLTPFTWSDLDTSGDTGVSGLDQSIIDLINSFMNRENVQVEYSPDGSDTFTGDAFVSDLSLTAGTEGNVEFSVDLASAGKLEKNVT